MLEVLDPVKAATVKTSTLSWQAVAMTTVALGFLAFAMWLFASKFDASELKTLLLAAGPVTVREFLPVLKRLLRPTTDMLASGGQLE